MADGGYVKAGESNICKCGCGRKTGRNKHGYSPSWIPGHRIYKKKPKEDWEAEYKAILENAPLCACGCGKKTNPQCGTLKRYIKERHNRGYYKYCFSHDKRQSGWNVEIPEIEKARIIGTLLGDGCIQFATKRGKSPRICWTHGLCQKEWMEHKAKNLPSIGVKTSVVKNRGYGEWSVRGRSRSLPGLLPIYTLFIKGGKKTITSDILSMLSREAIAWWFCDDGSCTKNGVFFHTHGYPKEENELIKDYFQNKYGTCYVRKDNRKNLYFISLGAHASRLLLDDIKDRVPECMQYKVRNYNFDKKDKARRKGIRP